MNKLLFALAVVFLLEYFMNHNLWAAQPKPPAGIVSLGGSNYAFCRIDDEYLLQNEPHAWWKPGVLQHAVGAFHLQETGYVQQSLQMMYQSGQRKIALVLWFMDIAQDKAAKGSQWPGAVPEKYKHMYGHTIDGAAGRLCPQHQENLRNLLELIHKTGFETVTIRFAAQGINNPMEWEKWEDARYKENLSFILSTKQIVDDTLKDKVEILYDLGLELGGLEGFCTEYDKRLWRDYTNKFGTSDTLGFSFAVNPGRLTNMLKIYKESGLYPAAYAFDVYFEADKVLDYIAQEFQQCDINNPAIIIQETFYNDSQTLKELQAAVQKHDLRLLYIVQWQVERAKMYWEKEDGQKYFRHFSVSRPIEYENYIRDK